MKTPQKKKQKLFEYARYSGIAFQMFATIALGLWGGIQLDEKLNTKFPVFTLVLTLSGVVLAMYQVIKDLINK